MNKDIIKQFFALSTEDQEQLVRAYRKREQILLRMKLWKEESDALNIELQDIRSKCTHPLVNEHKQWDSDEYGKMLSNGWLDYTCPDCGIKWTEEFKE